MSATTNTDSEDPRFETLDALDTAINSLLAAREAIILSIHTEQHEETKRKWLKTQLPEERDDEEKNESI